MSCAHCSAPHCQEGELSCTTSPLLAKINPLGWRYQESAGGELKVKIPGFNPQLSLK